MFITEILALQYKKNNVTNFIECPISIALENH